MRICRQCCLQVLTGPPNLHRERIIAGEYGKNKYEMTGSAPVAITGGELEIGLGPVAESIRELGSL